jgi:hypothetical protein
MEFYAAMIVPLYMRCYDVNKNSERPQQIYATMESFEAFKPYDSPDNLDKGFYGVPTRYCNILVLPKNLGLGLGTMKILGFFELLVLVRVFTSSFKTKKFQFFNGN